MNECCVSGTRVLGNDMRFSANNVMGLTSIDNKLFAVGIKSNEIFAMSADEPFTRSEKDGIEMTSLMTSAVKYPFDMTSSLNIRSMFVSDFTSKCLWRIGMDTKQIRRCSIDGSPLTLSTTAADELLVLVKRDKSEASRWNLGLYSTDDAFKRLRTVPLPEEVKDPLHAVKSSSGTFFLAYGTGCLCESAERKRYSEYLIAELSAKGEIIRRLTPTQAGVRCWPRHLAIDKRDNLFIADYDNNRVIVMDTRTGVSQTLLTSEEHGVRSPNRLCYIQDKQCLVVGQFTSPGSMSVFEVTL